MRKNVWTGPSVTALALALAQPVSAQTAPADEATAATPASEQATIPQPITDSAPQGGLSDIIVTATRRDTNLQRTPIAVSAIDQSIIQQASPRNIGDLATFVPNFSASTITGFNAASFSIRGVGQNTIIVYFEPPVAVLVDDFVVPSVQTQLLDTFDVGQVEVLRGPQGTLFGKNTTGGAVVVKTKRPVLNEIGVEGRLQAGSFGTINAAGAVNIPIGDWAAFRGVIGSNNNQGYYRNGGCFGPVTPFANGPVADKFRGVSGCGDGRRLGGTEAWNARAKLLIQPSDRFDALLQYEYLRDRSDSVPAVNLTPDVPRFVFSSLGLQRNFNPNSNDPLDNAAITDRQEGGIRMRNGQRINVDGVYLNMNLKIGEIGTLTSVSGYRKQTSRLPNTYPGVAPVAPDGTVLSLFDASRDDDRKTYQQEVRFATSLPGPFQLVAGGFYQRDRTSYCVTELLGFLDLVSGPLPFGNWNDQPYVLCNAQRAKSTAAFAEGTLKLSDTISLTGGARYTWERKRWFGRQQVFPAQLRGGFDPTIPFGEALDANVFDYPANVIQVRARANEPTYRGSLSWQATPEIFLYGTYSRGFKGGGFNDQVGTFAPFTNADGSQNDALFAAAAAATKPEKADSFEVGIKTQLFDRRLRFNLTGFHVTYSDLQKQIVVPLVVNGQPFQVTTFFNAAKARVQGIEAELTALPTEGLTLRGVLGYLDGKYKNYVTPIPAGYNLADAPLDRTPKWQWTADATYEVPIGNYKIAFNGNVNYVARNLFTQSIDNIADNTYLNARTLVNASITLAQVDGAYYVRVIGQNLTDRRYRTAQQVVAGLWDDAQYGPPRYYGLELGLKLGSRTN